MEDLHITTPETESVGPKAIAGVVWGATLSGLGFLCSWYPASYLAMWALVLGGVALGRSFTGHGQRAFFAIGLLLGLPGAMVGTIAMVLSLFLAHPLT